MLPGATLGALGSAEARTDARLGAVSARPVHGAFALLAATRPRQWVKNILVFAVPAAAGTLFRPPVLGRSVAAAALFLGASAGGYLLNDVRDISADRVHPIKRTRPIAAGDIGVLPAVITAAALLVGSCLGAFVLAGPAFAAVIGAYVAITASYSFGLKRLPVVELACVSSGFVLRAVAGGAAAHLPISPWFLSVTSAGALLLVAGKRTAELRTLGADLAAHRSVLAAYPEPFLRFVRAVAATVALTSYGLWAFDRASHLGDIRPDADDAIVRLSIVPFVIAMLVTELAIERGEGGTPEDFLLSNRTLQILGGACVVLVLVGVYT